jgi:hypothetical protein
VRCAAGVRVFERGSDNQWHRDGSAEEAFHGAPVGPRIIMARSRSNFDPTIHDTPEWENLDPAELLEIGLNIPDCPGDLDGDGEVGVSDLVALILAWGPCSGCAADLDGNGAVGVSDLVALVLAWGPCPVLP